MNSKYKTYAVKGEVSNFSKIVFDKDATRKKALLDIGLSPELTDEELKEYKTSFGVSFFNILDVSEDEQIPVLEYLDIIYAEKQTSIDLVNDELTDDNSSVETNLKYITIEIKETDNEDAIIKAIESKENFVKWAGEFALLDTSDAVSVSKVDLRYYKVGADMIVCPPNGCYLFEPLMKHVRENDLTFSEKFYDSQTDVPFDVVTIFQYIDNLKKTDSTLVDMVVDVEKTNEQNAALIPNMEFPKFISGATVENFDPDATLNNLFDL